MVADSPYDSADLLLGPGQGLVAGAMGGLWMGLTFGALTGTLSVMGAAWVKIVACASVLGVLYALCQQRAPRLGLAAVGVFYGVFIWVLGVIGSRLVAYPATRAIFHSRCWLAACLVFSLWLAVLAISRAQQRRPERTLPKD